MSITRFTLRDNVTLRLLKLCFYMTDVTGLFKAVLHKANRLVLQCINGIDFKSHRGRNKFCQFKIHILTL